MMNENEFEVEGHSEKLFTESRNHWYNDDFLDLMAKRWGLSQYRSLLDVGAGLCHWNKLLLPYLKEKKSVTAVDADSKWAQGSEQLDAYFAEREVEFEYLRADAHSLPFPNDSFDVVTCQTVLIHLPEPIKALSEMKRVVKPDGIVICAEPSNRAQLLLQDSVTRTDDIPTTMERVKMGLAQEEMKKTHGNGDNSLGDLLTGIMSRIGFRHIQSYLNDKVVPIFPPYTRPEQQAAINNYLGWKNDERLYEKEKEHLAELNEQDFNAFLQAYDSRLKNDRMLAALKTRTYHNGGASIMYLVSGKK
jgi:ubiquinone/menaquinone biosynthesis C-methylase UbiE